jgi:hypothetical protein
VKTHPALRPVASLEDHERTAMCALLATHFEGVDRPGFDEDLCAKTHALLLHDESGRLTGFSTLRYERGEFAGERIGAVWSGDTIVDPSARASPLLSRAWIRGVLSLHDGCGDPLWWLLITSGYRTYRFLPLFFQRSWPRVGAPLPGGLRALRDALAVHLYHETFDATNGLVRLARPQPLRAPLAGMPPGRIANDRDLGFFLAQNPGHVRGDELVCLAQVLPESFTAAGRRMLGEPTPA